MKTLLKYRDLERISGFRYFKIRKGFEVTVRAGKAVLNEDPGKRLGHLRGSKPSCLLQQSVWLQMLYVMGFLGLVFAPAFELILGEVSLSMLAGRM